LKRRRLRLIYTTKGREVWVWLSKVGSRPGESNARSWIWDQLTTTLVLWQSVLPRLVEVSVGAKMRKDREWRACIMRQIAAIVRVYRELVEVVVIISTLA
jgi:hypothetical protein